MNNKLGWLERLVALEVINTPHNRNVAKIAERVGCCEWTVYHVINKLNINQLNKPEHCKG
jgi:hypothetical protein